MYGASRLSRRLAQLAEIDEIVALASETTLAIIPALHDVESDAWNRKSWLTCHSRTTVVCAPWLTNYDPDPELALRKPSTARLKASGCSQNAEWPQPGSTSACEPAMIFWKSSITGGGM